MTETPPSVSQSQSQLSSNDTAIKRMETEKEVQVSQQKHMFFQLRSELETAALTIIVFGGSGHLAKTKTFPALFDLFLEGVFPNNAKIVGYARSNLTKDDFNAKVTTKLSGSPEIITKFCNVCHYCRGVGYDDDESFKKLSLFIESLHSKEQYQKGHNLLCYLATPPSVFVDVCERIKKYLIKHNNNGWTRVIVEKPFGRDLESSNILAQQIGQYLNESQIYRIDHYLAKEMVQNIIVFRFSNIVWDAIWNNKYIRCVKISMKESAALDGRGGYYDEFGVIRDVFQNHLLQVLTLIAMEQPVSLKSEDVRDEKVKVLKCIQGMNAKRTVIGQYGASKDGKLPGYREDPSIKNSKNPNSNQITFCQSVLYVNNHRWKNVPFICKCGKALDARNTEIRIQFRNDGLCLFPDANFNEIVMRLQPNEAIWLKVNTKKPGFSRFDQAQSHELDLTYKQRFAEIKLPAAYTRLILDSLLGDQSLFVRSDELEESWRIVTPFIKELEKNNKDPPKYPRGSRGPEQADIMAFDYGFRTSLKYTWEESPPKKFKL